MPYREGPTLERQEKRHRRDVEAKEEARRGGPPGQRAGRGSEPAAVPARVRLDELLPEDLEQLPTREKHGRRRSDSVERRARKLRASAAGPETEAGEAPEAGEGLVVAITRGECDVELCGATVPCHLPKALTLAQQSELAVGDRIRLGRRPNGALVAAEILPRRNRLSRPDPLLAHRERVLAANLDLAVIVTSVRRPPFSPGLVDRFLVALAHGGVAAALVVNKIDLLDQDPAEEPELAALASYRALGHPLLFCSQRSGSGLEALARLLAGQVAVFVGHSGVGKSSLLAALAPQAEIAVGDVSAGNARGRHTTSRSRIYRLDNGARVIDTPGIREFGLWRMEPRELASYFDEFAPHLDGCHFSNCTHTHEPRCAVRAAAERRQLSPERYAAYLRILESLATR